MHSSSPWNWIKMKEKEKRNPLSVMLPHSSFLSNWVAVKLVFGSLRSTYWTFLFSGDCRKVKSQSQGTAFSVSLQVEDAQNLSRGIQVLGDFLRNRSEHTLTLPLQEKTHGGLAEVGVVLTSGTGLLTMIISSLQGSPDTAKLALMLTLLAAWTFWSWFLRHSSQGRQ